MAIQGQEFALAMAPPASFKPILAKFLINLKQFGYKTQVGTEIAVAISRAIRGRVLHRFFSSI